MKFALVTTTIYMPVFLEKYFENFREFQHATDEVSCIVVGDKKTPAEVGSYLSGLTKRFGYTADYWDEKRQVHFLQSHPELSSILEWNSIQRRNLGFFLAWSSGAEIVISVDDDNHLEEGDYLKCHGIVGELVSFSSVESSSGWYNVCELMPTDKGIRVYHRGYPVSKRWIDQQAQWSERRGRCVVNAGLWLGEPDVDAMTHIVAKAQITSVSESARPHFALGRNTWCPFNSQNTAYSRELIPSLYLITMGTVIDGVRIGRYDDIFQSYFIQKIAQLRGDLICYGEPVVRQIRNPHNYLTDLLAEIPGMLLTNLLINELKSISLGKSDYLEGYRELASRLRNVAAESGQYTNAQKQFVEKMCREMLMWSSLF